MHAPSIVTSLVIDVQEYGHYATDQEVAAAAECTICFDQPVCPVALNCSESARCIYLSVESLSDHQQPHCALGHVFCECCIHEWIERERSCPVCRFVHALDQCQIVYMPT